MQEQPTSRSPASVVIAALTLLFMLPVLLPRYLPFPDEPVHAGQLFILMHADDASLRFPEFYDVTGWLHPYTPHRLLLWPIALLAGPERAYRVLLAATIAGVVAAIAWMLRRQRKSPWLTLVCFPALYSYPLCFGFATYSAAVAALLFVFIAVEAWLESPSPRALVVVALLLLGVFLLHPQVFVYACVMVPLLALLHVVRTGTPWPRMVPLAATLGPGVLLELAYVTRSLAMTSPPDVQVPPISLRLNALTVYAGGIWQNDVISGAFYVLAFTVILARVLGPAVPAPDSARERLWNARYVVMGVVFLAASALLPEVFRYQHYISSRMVPMALLLVPWMLGDSPSWRGKTAPLVASIAVTALGMNVLTDVMIFDASARPFDAVVEKMPRGARYRCLMHDARIPEMVKMPAFDGFCSYILVEKGGFAGPQWEHTGIRFKPPYATNLDLPGDWKFTWREHGDWYDFYITHLSAPSPLDEGGPLNGYVELVAQEGPFKVWRRTKSMADAPL